MLRPSVPLAQREVEVANKNRLERPDRTNGTCGPVASSDVRAPKTYRQTATTEWSAALERPLPLSRKAGLDLEIGSSGVALAETAIGDARHELSRFLLKSWFDWLREAGVAGPMDQQVSLLERQSAAVSRRQQLGDAARIRSGSIRSRLVTSKGPTGAGRQPGAGCCSQSPPALPRLAGHLALPLADPVAPAGDAEWWIARVLEHNHELALAEGEGQRSALMAERARRDRIPDPSIGVSWTRERGGEENGDWCLYQYSATWPGPICCSRRRGSAGACSQPSRFRSTPKITAEAAALYHSAQAAMPAWQAARTAASRLAESARLVKKPISLARASLGGLPDQPAPCQRGRTRGPYAATRCAGTPLSSVARHPPTLGAGLIREGSHEQLPAKNRTTVSRWST